MARHVALLRGVNVGGKNVLPMARLRGAFEAMGFGGVRTHGASGNVVFEAAGPPAALERRIEAGLAAELGLRTSAMVRSRARMRAVVEGAPRGWPDPGLRCNVVFLKAPLTPRAAMVALQPVEGVDTLAPGRGVVYAGTRRDALARSGLPRVARTEAYRRMTLRTLGACQGILGRMEA